MVEHDNDGENLSSLLLALLNWVYNRKLKTSERTNPALLAGVGIFAISATVSFILWFQMVQKEALLAKKVSLEEASLIKHKMEKSLNATLLALQRMAKSMGDSRRYAI